MSQQISAPLWGAKKVDDSCYSVLDLQIEPTDLSLASYIKRFHLYISRMPSQANMPSLNTPATPLAEETTPLAEETTPLAEETTPLAEETTPLAEETTLLADQRTASCVSQLDRLKMALQNYDEKEHQKKIELWNRVNRELVTMITNMFDFILDPTKEISTNTKVYSYEIKLSNIQVLLWNPSVKEIFDTLEKCEFEIRFFYQKYHGSLSSFIYLNARPRVFQILHSIDELSSCLTLNDVKDLIHKSVMDGKLPELPQIE